MPDKVLTWTVSDWNPPTLPSRPSTTVRIHPLPTSILLPQTPSHSNREQRKKEEINGERNEPLPNHPAASSAPASRQFRSPKISSRRQLPFPSPTSWHVSNTFPSALPLSTFGKWGNGYNSRPQFFFFFFYKLITRMQPCRRVMTSLTEAR